MRRRAFVVAALVAALGAALVAGRTAAAQTGSAAPAGPSAGAGPAGTAGARPFTYRVDVRQGQAGSDKLGLDFDLRYRLESPPPGGVPPGAPPGSPRGVRYGVEASATGFQDFDRAVTGLDAMAAEAALAGRSYRVRGLTPAEADTLRRLFLKPPAALTPAERATVRRLQGAQFSGRRFVTFGAHYRFETTQRMDVRQNAVGAYAAGELPMLTAFLDAVPSLLRSGAAAAYRPQPPRVYASVDYVRGGAGAAGDTVAGVRSPRATLEAAWATRVLADFVLRATWQAQYLFDAPRLAGAPRRDFNSFVQVWAALPLGERTSLIAKYADGRLPPTYANTSTARLGFSVAVQ